MPTFPAHDEEPPPRPLWQVFLGVLGGAVLLGGGTPVDAARTKGPAWISWSHDGASPVFGADGGHTLHVLHVTSPRTRQCAVPVHCGGLSPCLWSPNDAYPLCDDYSTSQRYVIQVTSGRTQGPLPIGPARYVLAWQPEEAS